MQSKVIKMDDPVLGADTFHEYLMRLNKVKKGETLQIKEDKEDAMEDGSVE